MSSLDTMESTTSNQQSSSFGSSLKVPLTLATELNPVRMCLTLKSNSLPNPRPLKMMHKHPAMPAKDVQSKGKFLLHFEAPL